MTSVEKPGGEPHNIPTMNTSGDEKEPSRDKVFKSASLCLDEMVRSPVLIAVFRRGPRDLTAG
jgi:hypothetical protein